jgi:glycosyltransferase involved in cell wall biosynthesis
VSAGPVLFLHSSAGRYGADRQLELLVQAAAPRHAIVVLPEDGELVGALRALGAEVTVRPTAVLRRELMSAGGLAGLARALGRDVRSLSALIRRRSVALVHSNTSVTLGGAAAAAAAGVPHVWHVRESYEGEPSALWTVQRRLLVGAAATVCVSRAVAAPLGPRARVIVDGLAIDVRGGDRAGTRAALGIGEHELVCLVIGRLSSWKGQDVLVRALAEPALRGRPLRALIVGGAWRADPAPARALERLAGELGVADGVALLGLREDVADLYAAADVVVVPSTRPDPLPGAAIEGGAAGRPVIASAHGGLPEIVQAGRTGLLVEPGSPSSLAAALAELEGDRERGAALGAAAARLVAERFSAARLRERIRALYAELLG